MVIYRALSDPTLNNDGTWSLSVHTDTEGVDLLWFENEYHCRAVYNEINKSFEPFVIMEEGDDAG